MLTPARNPLLAIGSVVNDVAPAGELSRVFPLVAAWTTSNLHAGQFTAACGVTIYRGDALAGEFNGNAFVCEPTGSLVHREIIVPRGVSFASRPATEGKEFLASDDPWFRPVNLEIGPDGALYVVDMYRGVIEHPQFMPSELQTRPDLRDGDDRGRIYRIVPAGQPPGASTQVSRTSRRRSWSPFCDTRTPGAATRRLACCWSAAMSALRRRSNTLPLVHPKRQLACRPCGCCAISTYCPPSRW